VKTITLTKTGSSRFTHNVIIDVNSIISIEEMPRIDRVSKRYTLITTTAGTHKVKETLSKINEMLKGQNNENKN
jgi:hypothetical protein